MSRLRYARALCEDTRAASRYEYTRGKLQAAHAASERLDRVSHVHFTNPDVLSSLRVEIDRDDASTAFKGRARRA